MQRSYLLLIFLSVHFSIFGQLHESFSDSEFSSNPAWVGETTFFKVSSNLELQSNGPNATAQLYLSTANERCRNTEWNFYARLDFDITTSNWARVYLTSDRSDTKNNPKGYYVKFEGSSNSVDLYRQDSTTHTRLIAGKNGRAGKTSLNIFRIKVICDPEGNWHLFSDSTGVGNHFEKEGTAKDTTFSNSLYCGVFFAHTSTRRAQFYFDDFTIAPAPLALLSAYATTNKIVTLTFSRTLHPASVSSALLTFFPENIQTESFSIHPLYKNKLVVQLSSTLNTYILYSVIVQGLQDDEHNEIGFINTIFFQYRINTKYGDLIISELLPDPSPPVKLPEAEYIELFNRTNDSINLQGFSLSDGTSTAVLPSFKLAPHSYIVICPANNLSLFSSFAPVMGVSSFPSLNNSSDDIVLKNQNGIILHDVHYTDQWYGDNVKKDGGWSLEIIDTDNPCTEASNWTASTDPTGGTPTRENSVAAHKPDRTPPQLLSATIVDSAHVHLLFDEKPDAAYLPVSFFRFDKPLHIQKASISSTVAEKIILEINPPFQKEELYTLAVSGVRDCNGNALYPEVSIPLLLPQEASAGNILINEVLFNPRSGGYDFVELYNHSEKYIDLKNWQLANAKEGNINVKKTISTEALILKPHEYIAFTENKSMLLNHYPLGRSECIVQLKSLPSYNDDKGSVILLNKAQEQHDRFDYFEKFHFALIDDKEGVSLERISPYEPTNNPHNWQSASSQSGYATPGYKNSQHVAESAGSELWIDPKVFTPDENGYNDFALIHYKFDKPGNVVNITIFDPYGRETIQLARNELLATEGFYRWDGNNALNEKVRTGLYIVYFELFNLDGEVRKIKDTVVVGP